MDLLVGSFTFYSSSAFYLFFWGLCFYSGLPICRHLGRSERRISLGRRIHTPFPRSWTGRRRRPSRQHRRSRCRDRNRAPPRRPRPPDTPRSASRRTRHSTAAPSHTTHRTHHGEDKLKYAFIYTLYSFIHLCTSMNVSGCV